MEKGSVRRTWGIDLGQVELQRNIILLNIALQWILFAGVEKYFNFWDQNKSWKIFLRESLQKVPISTGHDM